MVTSSIGMFSVFAQYFAAYVYESPFDWAQFFTNFVPRSYVCSTVSGITTYVVLLIQ